MTKRYFGLRLENTAFKQISELADSEHLSISSLLRKWIMERLESELGGDTND